MRIFKKHCALNRDKARICSEVNRTKDITKPLKAGGISMKTMRIIIVPFLAIVLLGCGSSQPELESSAKAASVEPILVSGNPDCYTLGDLAPDFDGFEFKPQPEPPTSGTYTFPDGVNTVTITLNQPYVDWSSTIGIDMVLVKGGPNANLYKYDPKSFGDTGLHPPINPRNNKFYDISHVTFCYNYEVEVEKTAETSFVRTYNWDIAKNAAETGLTLQQGEVYGMAYNVNVFSTGYEDSDWTVEGAISVTNPAPVDATVASVTDNLDGTDIDVDCGGVSFPYELAPGETLVCSYSAVLQGTISGTNIATATTSGKVKSGSTSVDFGFDNADIIGIDECVDVDDDPYGHLGTVCIADSPKVFEYTMEIGPYEDCGLFIFENTARFEAEDTGAEGSVSVLVEIDVECIVGCTLTRGYWQTHSEYGPAPYDDTWAMLADGADTLFFLSEASYYQVIWTSPEGNPYEILASQYIAAELNMLNNADFTDAAQAFNEATNLFNQYTPEEVAQMDNSDKGVFIDLAAILDEYNNGLIGPGACN